MNTKTKLAFQDLVNGMTLWRIWLLLSWQDIRLRYRRSQLGPFWLTLSMAVTIYSLGFLYARLFKMDLKVYFPFLAAGLLSWSLIVGIINESTNAFIDASGYLKQIKLPYLVFVLRVVIRNIIIFLHNILAFLPILFFAHIPFGFGTFFALLVGLLVIIVTGTIYGLILAMLGSRYRDIAPVISSLTQVIFFLTPVMWMPKILPEKYQFIVKFNPFAQFIDLIRSPLMGMWPTSYTYFIAALFISFGLCLMFYLFSRSRHRIIYWL
jgi:lipopolysaccharide transport system permease protein